MAVTLCWLSLGVTVCLLAATLIAMSRIGYGKPPKSRQEELGKYLQGEK